MKKILFIIPVLAAASLFFGCGDDKKLAFINSADSDGAINNIVWADGDQNWSTSEGYAKETQTESKDVKTSVGSVACDVSDGTSFVSATVDFSGAGESLALGDGENVFTLKANVGNASVKK